MTRRPEHIVLVAGGSGEVGEGIVTELLAAGHVVVVPTRSPHRAEQVQQRHAHHRHLVVVVSDLSQPEEATQMRRTLRERDLEPTDVVASLGGWSAGAGLIDLDHGEWVTVLDAGLHAHFVTAHTFLPQMREARRGSYLLLNGGAARTPIPGSGAVSVSSAAQLMLGLVLHTELESSGVRVRTLIAGTPVLTRSRPRGRADWLQATTIGALCSAVIGGSETDVVTELSGELDVEARLRRLRDETSP